MPATRPSVLQRDPLETVRPMAGPAVCLTLPDAPEISKRFYARRRRGGGIKRYRDPSVCLSHGAAALGEQLP